MATGTIKSYVGAELVDVSSSIETGFTGTIKYFKRGKNVNLFVNWLVPTNTGSNQLIIQGLPRESVEMFGVVSNITGKSLGLAYIANGKLYANISEVGQSFFSIAYECQ